MTGKFFTLLALTASLACATAQAGVMRIGNAVEQHGMKVQGLYIQAVVMHGALDMPGGGGAARPESDIHLEAAVHALENNPHGFPAGSWIPYMKVDYQLEKSGSDWKAQGTLVPMAASDGPHYGDNLKLGGPGKYKVVYTFNPPAIPYHGDRETGVAEWWAPFTVEWEFPYFGTGKKGGY